MQLGIDSDVVIIGSASEKYIYERLKQNKLTFRYLERPFKKGLLHSINLSILASMIINHTCLRRKNIYILCASAYTPIDFKPFHAYPNKMWKWGYFTEVKKYDLQKLIANKEQATIHLLWAGRFLGWKHPEKQYIL